MRDLIWKSHDGRRTRVSDLHLSHLRACIAMIQRGHDAQGRRVTRKTARALPRLLLELDIRGVRSYDNDLWC